MQDVSAGVTANSRDKVKVLEIHSFWFLLGTMPISGTCFAWNDVMNVQFISGKAIQGKNCRGSAIRVRKQGKNKEDIRAKKH
jgi:hypothetical protein